MGGLRAPGEPGRATATGRRGTLFLGNSGGKPVLGAPTVSRLPPSGREGTGSLGPGKPEPVVTPEPPGLPGNWKGVPKGSPRPPSWDVYGGFQGRGRFPDPWPGVPIGVRGCPRDGTPAIPGIVPLDAAPPLESRVGSRGWLPT